MCFLIRVNELKGEMVKKGYTQAMLANKMGIAPETLSRKLKKGVFGSNEIAIIIKTLNIKNPLEIFFADTVA